MEKHKIMKGGLTVYTYEDIMKSVETDDFEICGYYTLDKYNNLTFIHVNNGPSKKQGGRGSCGFYDMNNL